jgi:hypothetical protein
MKATRKQQSEINKILMQNLKLHREFREIPWDKELGRRDGMSKAEMRDMSLGDTNELFANLINRKLENIRDPKQDVTMFRRVLRRMHRWFRDDITFENKDFDNGFHYAIELMMGMTKKMLKDERVDHYFADNICLKCYKPLRGTVLDLTNSNDFRGYVHENCDDVIDEYMENW